MNDCGGVMMAAAPMSDRLSGHRCHNDTEDQWRARHHGLAFLLSIAAGTNESPRENDDEQARG
jgi:hypothetical protein